MYKEDLSGVGECYQGQAYRIDKRKYLFVLEMVVLFVFIAEPPNQRL